MELRSRRKLTTTKSSNIRKSITALKSIRPFCPTIATTGAAAETFFAADLPTECLKDVVIYCSVPVRCKLRRLCSRWQHLVCLPEISGTVHVDPTCLVVSNPSRTGRRKRKSPRPGYAGHTPRDRLQFGWYKMPPYKEQSGNLFDHHRHGILGFHVHTLIFDGLKREWNQFMELYHYSLPCELHLLISSIALHCSNVQRIVYWRTSFGADFLTSKDSFLSPSSPPSCLPAVTDVRLQNCLLAMGRYYPMSCIKRWVDFWSISQGDLPEEVYSDHDLNWLSKHTSRLPRGYQQWIRQLERDSRKLTGNQNDMSAINLTNLDVRTIKNHHLLRLLGFLIQHERLRNISPIPYRFNCYWK